jgi:integrase/recombinase XerD
LHQGFHTLPTGTTAYWIPINTDDTEIDSIVSGIPRESAYQFEMYLVSKGLRRNTIRHYLTDVLQYLEWVEIDHGGNHQLDDNEAYSYLDYLRDSAHRLRANRVGSYSPNTVLRKLYSICRFYDFLIEISFLQSNPFREIIKSFKLQMSPIQNYEILPLASLQKLVAHCDLSNPIGIRDRCLLMAICVLGLRAGEIRHLDVKDLSFIEGSITIRGRDSRARTLPLVNGTAEAFRHWLQARELFTTCDEPVFVSLHNSSSPGSPGMRLSLRGIRKIVDRRLEAIGKKAPGISCEVVRRSALFHLVSEGVELDAMRSTFGLSPKTFQIYQDYIDQISTTN